MKKNYAILAGALAASSLSASGTVLVAGWEDFTGTTSFATTQIDAVTTVTVDGAATVGNWGQWTNGTNQGPSIDGTFGDLSATIASANMNTAAGSNLSLGRTDGTLVFTLTNNSGADRELDGFYFDTAHKFGNSADAWTLSFSGAISGTDASGSVTQSNGGLSAASPADRNKAVDLTGLGDNVWENGADAIFTLTFSGAANDGASSGGNELLLDNIAITAVPEPSALALGMLGTGFFFLRRRRA